MGSEGDREGTRDERWKDGKMEGVIEGVLCLLEMDGVSGRNLKSVESSEYGLLLKNKKIEK